MSSYESWEGWYIVQQTMTPEDDIDFFEKGMSEEERQQYWKNKGD